MDSLPSPLAFVLLFFAGSVNRQQQAIIDYLIEENRSSALRLCRTGCASPTASGAARP